MKFVVTTILVLVSVASAASAQGPNGAALYQQNCRACHGAKGVPPQRMLTIYPGLKTLADSTFMAKLSTDSIGAVIKHGAGKFMPPFGDKLSADEIAAVAKFVKALPAAPHGP